MIDKVKFFMHRDLLNDKLFISKDLYTLMDIYDKNFFGIIETESGDNVFEIEFNCDNAPYVYRRFMHIDSFFKFNTDLKIKCLDKSSIIYINNVKFKN